MPALEVSDLHEYAVLWVKHGTNRQGDPVLRYPQQVPARWSRTRRQSTDAKGQVVATDADVAIAYCGDEELEGSLVWDGKISEVPGTADPPTPTSGLYEVVGGRAARDVKGRSLRRELRLARFNDTMPTVVDALS